jgi:hypothetical protein
MVPDLPIFYPHLPPYEFTHSWLGMLVIDLPLGVALTIVWWTLVRPGLFEAAPRATRAKLPETWRVPRALRQTLLPWRQGIALVIAVAIGVASHILWDSFTHESGWAVEAIPLMRENWGPLPGFRWAQYASSGLGLLAVVGILVVTARAWPTSSAPARRLPVAVPLTLLCFAIIPIAILSLRVVWSLSDPSTLVSALIELLAGGVLIAFGGCVILTLGAALAEALSRCRDARS